MSYYYFDGQDCHCVPEVDLTEPLFDGRPWEEWSPAELLACGFHLGNMIQDATGEEREMLIQRESDVLRCLGWLRVALLPGKELLDEWESTLEKLRGTDPFSMDAVEILTRLAEVERAMGADLHHLAREYRCGNEPLP